MNASIESDNICTETSKISKNCETDSLYKLPKSQPDCKELKNMETKQRKEFSETRKPKEYVTLSLQSFENP